MKPTSIIFLIISVIMVAGGIFTCHMAEKSAEAENIKIFSQELDQNNNSKFNYDFSESSINKFEIIVDDADINIYGGAEESMIELINFTEGLYSFNASAKIISLSETPDITSMFKFWENGFHFNGLRHFIKFGKNEVSGDKIVNIYLAPDETVKVFNLKSAKGNISLQKVIKQADYNIECSDGTLTIDSLKTTSAFSVKGKKCFLNINNSYLRNLSADIYEGDINADKLITYNIALKLHTGDAFINMDRSTDTLGFELACKSGKISVNGKDCGTEYKVAKNENHVGMCSVRVTNGNIIIN